MSFHQCIVNGWLHSVRGPPSLQREDAFFHALLEGVARGWDVAYMKEFPKAKTLSLQELEQRRSPRTEGVVVRRA